MQVESILALYQLDSAVTLARPYGDGHINDTYRVETDSGRRYILQRLSPAAFKEPEKVMQNVSRVTAFLREAIRRRGGDPERETLRIIPMADGKEYLMADDGCWRMYGFIGDTKTYQQAENEAVFREAGRAFGRFMRDLADYPADTLHETIPRFHDTENRLAAFKAAVQEDRAGRAGQVQAEIAFVLERGCRAGELLKAGLPLRVTHNDTKLNNVLMNAADSKALCVVDLDTVMPGLCAYDFGDAIRFGANTAAEDEQDLKLVECDLDMYAAFTQGWLEAFGSRMTEGELALLPLCPRVLTLECGVRFLTDYLQGDTYFATSRPGQNLDRCRTQLKLVEDMEKKEAEMTAIVREFLKK